MATGTDVQGLVERLQSVHILMRDAGSEFEDELPQFRGAVFVRDFIFEAIGQLEQLGDLLSEHFGVPFFHDAPQEDVVRIAFHVSPDDLAALLFEADQMDLGYKVLSTIDCMAAS